MNTKSAGPWLALCGLVAAVAVAVFAPSLGNGFVFDDLDLVTSNPRIRDLSQVGLLVDGYRPLRTLTYAIDYRIWGLSPTGFRITNIAIHVANCALALFVARRLTGGARIASVAAVLLFAIHPVQVESVAYISGRRDVLFALFYLAAFLAWTRFREAETTKARAAWLAATGVGLALSLMSKEMAASLPVACVLWDLYRASEPDAEGGRPPLGAVVRRIAREGAVLYSIGFVTLVAFAYYTVFVRGATTRLGQDVRPWGGTMLTNTLTVPLTYAHYVWLTIWPGTLAVQYYGAFEPATGFTDPRVWPAIALLVALVAGSLYLLVRTSHRVVGFGIAWFLVTLLPASQILPHHEIVADHYLYLPMVGAGIAVAGGLVALEQTTAPSWRKIAYAVVGVALVLLSARTVVRERDFRDEATLWQATYAAVPDSPRAAYNYGLVLTGRGEHVKAADLYRRSIAGDPTFIQAYFNLGSTYAGLGKFDEARNVYRSALKSDIPTAARAWHMKPEVLTAMYRTELAMLDAQAGDTAGARDALAAILEKTPNLLRAEDFYATIVQQRGEIPSAIEAWRARADAAPAEAGNRLVLANLLWKSGRVDEAADELRRVLEIQDENAYAHLLLARYYKDIRPTAAPSPTAAATHFARAYETAVTDFDRETISRASGEVASDSLAG